MIITKEIYTVGSKVWLGARYTDPDFCLLNFITYACS